MTGEDAPPGRSSGGVNWAARFGFASFGFEFRAFCECVLDGLCRKDKLTARLTAANKIATARAES